MSLVNWQITNFHLRLDSSSWQHLAKNESCQSCLHSTEMEYLMKEMSCANDSWTSCEESGLPDILWREWAVWISARHLAEKMSRHLMKKMSWAVQRAVRHLTERIALDYIDLTELHDRRHSFLLMKVSPTGFTSQGFLSRFRAKDLDSEGWLQLVAALANGWNLTSLQLRGTEAYKGGESVRILLRDTLTLCI